DINDNGIRDSGEPGIGGVIITVSGTDYLGNAVNKTVTTASDGTFSLSGLLPSGSAGYTATETQPAGFVDGIDAVGTLNGNTDGVLGTDAVSQITIPGCGNNAINYNFGELGIFHGLTATIGFWHNKNGQLLINSFGTTSGGQTLANWLATSMPNLF